MFCQYTFPLILFGRSCSKLKRYKRLDPTLKSDVKVEKLRTFRLDYEYDIEYEYDFRI